MVITPVSILGYRISEELYNGSRTLVYRGYRETDSLRVVIKLLKNPYPSFSELVQFRHQYTIAKNLNSPLIIQTYSLEPYQNGYVLVMEDFGGISLKEWRVEGSVESLMEFLRIAIALCNSLDILYHSRIIHKDIKPANILINLETKQVKLIDFSIASLLPRETQTLINPNFLEGTLSYISPEQTGRMNRGIDYRTDFYSLGVTFYELLTGELPFQSNDPMELVHCHIAKLPSFLGKREEIPQVLCDLVMKLMAKNAEDRYQSALGIKFDLENCLTQLQETGKLESFEIAQKDVCARFLIREKLYGRETEVQQLLEAFERVSQGSSELMLVAGFSGIGKTSVVNEVHKPIVQKRGYFISGKFDQFRRNVPYSAIVVAFRKLIQQLLTESESQFNQWREKLQNALQNSGEIIIELIPEIELIIGKQPPVPELGAVESQIRFNSLFQRFIGIFCAPEHPLVIFLDDLQWADTATLKLLELMLTDDAEIHHLFVIGAYRDNEVEPTHPLLLIADKLRKADVTINQIILSPLSLEHVSHLIADTFHSTLETIQPLSNLTIRKTEGNPFFVNEFLKALHQEELLKFHLPTQQWRWNIDQIEAMGITDNVVELMVGKLKKLPASTQQILSLAACVGASFDLTTLSIIYQQSRSAVYADLMAALQLGFILPTAKLDTEFLIPTYRFGHDRVQQAADALIPVEKQRSVHLKIGRLILQHSSPEMIAERLFEIVDHLNLGIELINQLEEQIELVRLNLKATLKAKAALAYEPALKYMLNGIKLMDDRIWDRDADLAMSMYRERADVEFLNGNFEASHFWIVRALEKARTDLEKADIYIRQMVLHTLSGSYQQALKTAYQAATLLEIEVPLGDPKPIIQAGMDEIEALLEDKLITSLLDLPEMTDPVKKLSMKLFGELIPTSYLARQELFPWVNIMMVLFSMKYGLHPEGFVGFACYGMILVSETEKYQEASEFGNVALKLSQQYNDAVQICRSCHIISSFLTIWVNHVRYSGEIKQLGGKADLTYAGYNQAEYLANILFAGNTVEDILTEIKIVQGDLQKFENQYTETITAAFQFFIMNLLGQSEVTIFYQQRDLSEQEFIQYCEESKLFAGLCTHYVLQLLRCYLFEDWENAYQKMRQAEALILNRRAAMLVPLFYFYSCLILTEQYPKFAFHEQGKIIEELQSKLKQIKVWSANCAENFEHFNWFVQAEIARISNQHLEAMELYDQAIASAHQHGFIHHEAIIHEQVAKFWLRRNKEGFANLHLHEAYYAYQKWGAKAKVADIKIRYSQLFQAILPQEKLGLNSLKSIIATASTETQKSTHTSKSGGMTISDALDFASILKAAQSISSSIELDDLITSLTKIILENVGAKKCVLILPQEDKWQIRAITFIDHDDAHQIKTSLTCQLVDDSQQIPRRLIQYVKHTLQTIVIDNCQTDIGGLIDDYMLRQQPQSALCTPILNQGNLVAIIYLENRLTQGVFTSDRLSVINLFCSQAAISLENARLYQKAGQALQDLQQAQLQIVQSEKMSALGNLVAGIAHEMNNPLGFISISLKQAKPTILDIIEHLKLYQENLPNPGNEIKEHAEKIDLDYTLEDLLKMINSMSIACDRLKNISTSLRTFSRADQDYKVPFNIHEGIDSTILILKHRLKPNEQHPAIEVITNYGKLPQIECFPGQLNQVFMNIMANAIDALEESNQGRSFEEIKANRNCITITTSVETNLVKITIADNGIGMSESVKEKIFDHLFTTKSVGKGTGLGLAIARQILVEKHNGMILVNSTLGEGTEFVITLPILAPTLG